MRHCFGFYPLFIAVFKDKLSNLAAERILCFMQSCGVQSNELGKVLHLLGMKNKQLVNLLHLLEFITWSLLKEDSTVSPTNVFQKIINTVRHKNLHTIHIKVYTQQSLLSHMTKSYLKIYI